MANVNLPYNEIRAAFIDAAIWHGPLDAAEALLVAHPQIAVDDIHVAAILGDADTVLKLINTDAAAAVALAPPFGGDALTYLSLSKYFRLKQRPESAFLQIAAALIDAGANPSGGFWTSGKYVEFIAPLYGAAGVAQHAGLTRLLLERGADPNDLEAVYHSPETYQNDAMKLIVNTGKLTPTNLAMMLVRKHDLHDYDGAKFLLDHGADPNLQWRTEGFCPLNHAIARGNQAKMIELLLDYNADPYVVNKGITAVAHAAREGRADILNVIKQRNIPLNLTGVDALIAACAYDDTGTIQKLTILQPQVIDGLKAMAGTLLTRFGGNGNAAGLKQLLDLGLDINARFAEGDVYFGMPKNSLPIHMAAWKGYPDVVKLLIARGSIIDEPDTNSDTPLMLAVRACVNSYWTYRRTPGAVAALLSAGADAKKAAFPSGYAEVDELLERYR